LGAVIGRDDKKAGKRQASPNEEPPMIVTTTDTVDGSRVIAYLGIVSGDAIVGVDLDYEVVGDSMLMVSCNGTAVKLG